MNAVHVVVPAGIDDPARPSGGNVYDRRVCDGLVDLGWEVHEHHVDGPWPCPDPDALTALTDTVSAVPDDAVLLVDGLVASVSATVLVPAARRLRMIVLVHLPLGLAGEADVLAAADAVVTTSAWARQRLLDGYALAAPAVHVVEPGVEPSEPVAGTPAGQNLLCVGPVTRHKGHDTLVSALAQVRDLGWHCRIVGSLEREPQFVDCVRRQLVEHGMADRVELCGARTGRDLAHTYASADLLVHASRGETYGMVITEALARALPVVATEVGGVPEALGDTCAGRPGLLVTVDEPIDLAAALRVWLTDDKTRGRLRGAAARRRLALESWDSTASRMSALLAAAVQ